MNWKQRVLMLLLSFGFVGQARTALTCYSGPANETTQCKQANEACVTVRRYTIHKELYKTEKGCFKNCTNKCVDEPRESITRCYTCCAENLCNGETKPTPTQPLNVTSNSIKMPTNATKKPNGTNAGMMKTSGMYLSFLIFLAQIFPMEFL